MLLEIVLCTGTLDSLVHVEVSGPEPPDYFYNRAFDFSINHLLVFWNKLFK